ncbi:MAG: lytic transglycosylase domain-containing protein [Alphaproteobacteria bacterium]|nr:lytic transglycosylase domain-containing protein [Alphaproteobacteria bacterium]
MTRTLMRLVLVTLFLACSQTPGHGAPSSDITPLTREEVRMMVVQEALRSARVPPSLALAVAHAESHFDPNAKSSAGARGVMQIMPATGSGEFGVDPDELWQPRLNIQLGIAFLGDLIDRYDGRLDLALSYYNGGSRVGTGATAKVIPATQGYVDKVLSLERRYASETRTAVMIADARSLNRVLAADLPRAEIRADLIRASRRVAQLEDPGDLPGRDIRDHPEFRDLSAVARATNDRHPTRRAETGGGRGYDRRLQSRGYLDVRDSSRRSMGDQDREAPGDASSAWKADTGFTVPVGGAARLLRAIEARKSRFRALLRGS